MQALHFPSVPQDALFSASVCKTDERLKSLILFMASFRLL